MGNRTAATVTLVLLLVMGLSHVSLARAQTPPNADLAAIFRQLTDAVNRGDVTGALAFFADDAAWVRGGACPPGSCTGTAAIRSQIEKDVSDGHHIDVIDTQVSGSTLTARVELRTDATRAAGTERIIHVFTLQFRGDKISSLQARPDLTDPATAAFATRGVPATGFGPQATAGPALPLGLTLGLLLAGGLLITFSFGMSAGRRKER